MPTIMVNSVLALIFGINLFGQIVRDDRGRAPGTAR